MELFAEVIVSIPNDELDRPFTYHVPSGMNVAVGSRVVVPFGARRLEGYCVALSTEPFGGKVRDIAAVLDDEPLLTPELVDLAAWGAARYLCRRLDFLQAMVPAGVRWRSREWVEYAGDETVEEAALVYLREKGGQPLSKWLKLFPGIKESGLLHSWQQSGIITVSGRETAGTREKTVKVYFPVPGADPAAGIGNVKQRAALELLRLRGELSANELAAAGVSSYTLRVLAERGLVKSRMKPVSRRPGANPGSAADAPLELTEAQREILGAICGSLAGGSARTILLHGVTGSGKTEVYLQAIASVLAEGKSSIVLVPEISLTPQMIDRFTARFGDRVALLHSKLSPGERYDEWRRILTGKAPVVIGTRSAVFAPTSALGLVILDEEHENSYKQEEAPRYHARDVAQWRAARHGAVVVLGSATPSLESYYLAGTGKYFLCRLPERIFARPLPPVEVIDMRQELKNGHKSIFSRRLLVELADTLAAGRQAILFLNRRGYATFVLCRECGFVPRCPECHVALKYHADGERLRCHYCTHSEPYPLTCPSCGGRSIRYFGTGTQKVEEQLKRYFPDIRIARLDTDAAARKGAHRRILNAFCRGEYQVLVGTQMVAKGLDMPNVTLVGVISADTALNLPDFRAGERTFQLLTQVAGRTGRGEAGGRVIVQTYAPEHYAVQAAKNHDFEEFYHYEVAVREALGYPPYSRLVRLLVSGVDEGDVVATSARIAAILATRAEVLGPAPCPIARLRGRFRWHVIIRSAWLEPLLQAAREATDIFRRERQEEEVRLVVDVDPQNLL